MSRKYSIWKINGFYREKIYFLLSCLLIYPIFRRHHYEIFAQQSIEGLALLRHNLLRIVRYRQNSIAVLYIKYHKIMPKIVNELSVSVMEEEVNIFTFSKVEFEIEGILQLIDSSINYNHQMFSEYYRVLS
jgi:hypothetical protein